MVKIVSKIVFLALVRFSLLTFSYPAETLALWAKRFDNNDWSEFGGVGQQRAGATIYGAPPMIRPNRMKQERVIFFFPDLMPPEMSCGPIKSTRAIMTTFLSANSEVIISFFRGGPVSPRVVTEILCGQNILSIQPTEL